MSSQPKSLTVLRRAPVQIPIAQGFKMAAGEEDCIRAMEDKSPPRAQPPTLLGCCEHGRARYGCVDCRGRGICEHSRLKYQCKDCGGGGICVHSRQRAKCKDCFPGLPQEDLQRGLGIGLMEPCWMRPPNTPENFAHLCLIVLTKRTNQSANCFFQESWLLSRV